MKSGDVIAGRYKVVQGPVEDRRLQGGMGQVYLCADRGDEGRPVALKTFHAHYLSNRRVRGLFLREADLWVRLGAHPHVVRARRVEHVGDGREVYVVADWVAPGDGQAGASLREYLRREEPIAPARALGWTLGMVRGLRHATDVVPGLVHRDLKPENVLVGRDGQARVTDFGLAEAWAAVGEAADEAATATAAPEPGRQVSLAGRGWAGTPGYMAPEQWAGAVDVRADMYALGCVVAELLTGVAPVRGATWQECRRAHQAGAAAAVVAQVPAGLRGWLGRCLTVAVTERPRTWAEVERELVAVHAAVTGEAAPAIRTAAAATRADAVDAGWSLNAIGMSYYDLGQAREAGAYFERARAAGEATQERVLEGAALGNLGNAYLQLGDARRAMGYFEQDLAIARELGDRRGEGQTLNNIGNVLTGLGDARRALGYYEEALAIARNLGDRREEAGALANLGVASADLGDARRAIGCFEQAVAIARELGDRYEEGQSLGNLGKAYRAAAEPRRCLEYSEQALAIFRAIGARRQEAEELSLQGGTYLLIGDLQHAMACWLEGLGIAEEVESKVVAGNCAFKLATILVKVGESDTALPLARKALGFYTDVGRRDWAADAAGLVAQIQTRLRP